MDDSFPALLTLQPTGDIATPSALAFFRFIAEQHGNQRRKYTREPYTNHLVSVAESVWNETSNHSAVAAALAHDVLEDTACTTTQLHTAIVNAGYADADVILQLVIDLTDVYTHTTHPVLNRTERKVHEAERLRSVAPMAQTIKYCDVMDNAMSICEYDAGFAPTYLREVQRLLEIMTDGNPATRAKAKKLISELIIRHDIQLS